MFNWNVEELKLLTMDFVGEGSCQTFACESEVSMEDKVEFVDRMQDGKLSSFLGLAKAYQEAIPAMKKDAKGNPTDYAKKAWVRKNDIQGLICRTTDSYNNYGDFDLLDNRVNLFTYHGRMETKGKEVEERLINNLFHRQLLECKKKEYDYFCSQDKATQLVKSVKKKYYEHRIEWDLDNVNLFFEIAKSPKEENTVSLYHFRTEQEKKLTADEVQNLGNALKTLDELQEQIKKAEQAYEEARLSLADKIAGMIG